MGELGTEQLTLAVQAIVTWLGVMAFRKLAPDFWEGLGGRRQRLVIVAISAAIVAVVSGVIAGDTWTDIGFSAFASLAGAIAIREATKRKPQRSSKPSTSRDMSYRSPVPDVLRDKL